MKTHLLYKKKSFWSSKGTMISRIACDNLLQGYLLGTFNRAKVTCKRCKKTKMFRKENHERPN